MKPESGKVEPGFVDSHKYNIAAYRLAELLGLDDLLPVYVEREMEGQDRLAELVAPGQDKFAWGGWFENAQRPAKIADFQRSL
jgi:hypothetical protein